jgi:hypothetical protein
VTANVGTISPQQSVELVMLMLYTNGWSNYNNPQLRFGSWSCETVRDSNEECCHWNVDIACQNLGRIEVCSLSPTMHVAETGEVVTTGDD